MSTQDFNNPVRSGEASLSRRKILTAAAIAMPAALILGPASGVAGVVQSNTATSKAALVTGSSRGIGAAIAKRLALDGYAVTVNYLNNRELAAGVVRDIESAGGKAIFEQADVSDAKAVRRLFDKHREAFGQVDIVVANAGIQRLGAFADMSDDDYVRLIDVNMKGVFHTLRESARQVSDGGRIIALSSGTTSMRPPTYGPYAASKAAVEVFVNILAKELAGRMISVNAVAPGTTNTSLFTDGKTPEQIAGFAQQTPYKRLGEPEDIANVVSILAGGRGGWINGQVVNANGGLV
ncbi:SDR family oxidoreductase [Pectobacterium wasabiae]|uniref:3-ketoacyl-ACP reductase n=1 Tax=Pectobacterium wasabiae TaxID=55208 RepID=A0AAW3ELD7_9GAMM|nr:SDR family oxidoreductase [Pectobacterium wasabiae]AOR64475.1 3-ketoacyl-ACP reductase [Pectobacterium wasabiae CFBP 3304]EJS92574.1 Putative short chain dehydrogenease [Pectobacterium wasabiae CFBP 3304]KFX09032.1 3-ketoacyl-ACP reductase [Pectobacterium wasabiae]KGA29139.1 3-ketoacyl-ACP reductase [Pectobacterium wasabiae]